jgi:hypothetical protein
VTYIAQGWKVTDPQVLADIGPGRPAIINRAIADLTPPDACRWRRTLRNARQQRQRMVRHCDHGRRQVRPVRAII